MARRPEDIIIQEPPIEELTRQYSCLRKSCFSCLTFLLIIVGISLILLKFALGSQTKTLTKIPVEVTRQIPLYDTDSIEKITSTEGKERNKGVKAASFLPKLIVSPFIASLDKHNLVLTKAYRNQTLPDLAQASWLEKVRLVVGAPIGDERDEIQIRWHEVVADPKFIAEYYETELTKRGFIIASKSHTEAVTQFTFIKDTVTGSVYIENKEETPETDLIIMLIQLDNQSDKSNKPPKR